MDETRVEARSRFMIVVMRGAGRMRLLAGVICVAGGAVGCAAGAAGIAALAPRPQPPRGERASELGVGSWSLPRAIIAGGLGTPDAPPAIAVDGRGAAVAVWSQSAVGTTGVVYSIWASQTGAGGGYWAPSTRLTVAGIDPSVSVDLAGEVVAVWQAASAPFGVAAAIRPAGGSWLGPVGLSRAAGESPQVATDRRGDALVVWAQEQRPWGVRGAIRAAGGRFGPPVAVSRAENAHYPRVAVNARGDAILSWEVDSAAGCLVRASFRAANGSWTKPRTLSDYTSGCPAQQQVAIDARGNAVIVWLTDRGPVGHIETATRRSSGSWSGRRMILTSPIVDDFSLAMDASGSALIVWSDTYRNFQINAISGSSTGGWRRSAAVRHLSGLDASVGLDSRGNALIVCNGNGIRVSTRRSGGHWQRAATVSRQRPGDTPPLALITRQGQGLVAWVDQRGIETAWHPSLFP